MDLRDIALDAFSRPFSQENRELRLRFSGRLGKVFDGVLLPQRMEGSEGICEGVALHMACLTNRQDMPPQQLIGVPIEVQQVTDSGDLRRWCVVIDEVRKGESDGSLTVLQLTGRDVFALMRRRRSHRRFQDKSVLQIAREVLDGWRRDSPALAFAFDYAFLGLDEAKYPPRALAIQTRQSDTEFLDSLLRRNGISWFFRAGVQGQDATPVQQLVLFDDARMLPANSAGPIRYHRRDGTEPRDTLNLLALTHTLSPGSVQHFSWDHEAARVHEAGERTIVDQGDAGNELAAALRDARIELPHAGDSSDDHQRLARIAMLRHEMKAQCLHGVGGVRAQSVGEYNRIDDFPALSGVPNEQREYISVRLEHWVENNLPKALNEYAQALLTQGDASGWINPPPPNTLQSADRAGGGQRHVTRFTAVRRDAPFAPAWDPAADLPLMPLMTATVVSNLDGEPIWCDEHGRVKVRIHGLQRGPDDTSPAWDTAWVRVNFLWCGPGFGVIFPLRAGMEVSIGFEMGDPSRPMIVGSRYNAANPPPRFDHLGSLPANRALSGIVTRELQGQRQQQLRFNDTPGHISVQLASDHGATQLNTGDLGTPMNQGRNEPRGEGFELRSDHSGALRTAKALLISAWKRLQASGHQLSAEEHVALMQDCLDLFKSLADYATQHQGLAGDDAPQTELKADVAAADGGSNVNPDAAGGQPTLSLTAPAGIATTTPKSIVSYAGINIDQVAQQHYQQTAGGRYIVNAGDGASLFAHQGGIRQIAHYGTLLLQSQHDDTQVDSAKNIKFSAVDGKIIGMAEEIVLIARDGSFLKLGGGVQLGSASALNVQTNGHHWGGPATMATDLPSFGEGDLGRTPQLLRPTDGGAVEGMQLEVQQPGAGTISGQTDASGSGAPITSDRLQRMKNFFFMRRS